MNVKQETYFSILHNIHDQLPMEQHLTKICEKQLNNQKRIDNPRSKHEYSVTT